MTNPSIYLGAQGYYLVSRRLKEKGPRGGLRVGLLSLTVRNVYCNDVMTSVGMDSVFGIGILAIYGHSACTGHER